MEVGRLPISASQRGKLIAAGYTTFSSLSSVSASQLVQADLNITEVEAREILKTASHSTRFNNSLGIRASFNGAQTAWDMLHEENYSRPITTSCENIDCILGGGIRCREVTEIGGVPGIGKTQLGIQLAVNVQLPADYGGLGGKAVYIDTEGSFMVERALQIVEGCILDMHHKKDRQQLDFSYLSEMQPKLFLENIYYFRVCSYTEQVALINYLDTFIAEHTNVKVVILDSITFHFRQNFDDLAQRTRVLGALALKLMKLAKKFSMAVVLLNQVTTKFADGAFQLTLALGDSWSHACTTRVILYWNGEERYAYIDKSPSLPSASAPYAITRKGIRDTLPKFKRVRLT